LPQSWTASLWWPRGVCPLLEHESVLLKYGVDVVGMAGATRPGGEGAQLSQVLLVLGLAPTPPLLTSDRPVTTTNGLGLPESHIIMPLSQSKVFVAVNKMDELNRLQALAPNVLADSINLTVVNNAVKYVWAPDQQQLRFIQNRMSSTVGSDEWLMAGLGP
jgi:hypothetical protein